MRAAAILAEHLAMTPPPMTTAGVDSPAPLARAARYAAGVSLILGGILNGLPQYLSHLISGDPENYIRWGAEHPEVIQAEQTALVVSILFLPIGLLGLAQVTRWRHRRLTAVAICMALWGMWGFHNILAAGYVAGSVTPGALGVEAAVSLEEAFLGDVGLIVTALLPHLVGSFIGILLLSILCWRSGVLPRTAVVLLVAFLIWDFLLPKIGPLEPHILLAISMSWLGVALLRLPDATWQGEGIGA
jgi:hypothetical protein